MAPVPAPATRSESVADVQATFCATLVDQWVLDGVAHAVVAPGSRSTPMALALANHADVHVHVFHDERSAAFAALGIGLSSAVPAVLLCTSGTAATHFHAAVAEADLSCVPMLVLTADRPPELLHVGAPQTIDQTKLYGHAVRWFHDPGVASALAAGSWRSLARQALSATVGAHPGPVHLNLPFREPLIGIAGDLPVAHLGPLLDEAMALRLDGLAVAMGCERGVIVAGRGVDDPAAVESLAALTGWPILADPRSGCRGLPHSVAAFDAILRHEGFADSHVPDVVVHLGEPPASKVLAHWLAAATGVQVRVHPTRSVIDPAHQITHRVVASVGGFCRSLANELVGAADSNWSRDWICVDRQVRDVFDAQLGQSSGLSEPVVARVVSQFPGRVMVASSMPIRDLEWFGASNQSALVSCNRGANGIDGTIATAIGIAVVEGAPVVVLLGDVAFLHDASSLTALCLRGVDVRIVVVDNDGGGIFSFLAQADVLSDDRFELLFGTPHSTDLVALAAAHGLPARTVDHVEELRAALVEPGPWLVRVPSGRAANVAVHRTLNQAAADAIT